MTINNASRLELVGILDVFRIRNSGVAGGHLAVVRAANVGDCLNASSQRTNESPVRELRWS